MRPYERSCRGASHAPSGEWYLNLLVPLCTRVLFKMRIAGVKSLILCFEQICEILNINLQYFDQFTVL